MADERVHSDEGIGHDGVAVAAAIDPEETVMSDTEADLSAAQAAPAMDGADAAPDAAVLEPAAPVEAAPETDRVRPKVRKAPVRRVKPAPAAEAKPAPAAKKRGRPRKVAATETTPATRPAVKKAAAKVAITPKAKEPRMDMNAKIKSAMTEAQDKAKVAYDKSTELFGEATEFTKGNVEAMVESGRILAAGLQDMGTTVVADTRESFETLTADVKAIAAVRSPTELVKLQSDIMRRNLDRAVALGSKNSEAMLKLANEMFAPISGRFSLAMDKVRKAA